MRRGKPHALTCRRYCNIVHQASVEACIAPILELTDQTQITQYADQQGSPVAAVGNYAASAASSSAFCGSRKG